MTESPPQDGHQNQLAALTKSVSQHDEILQSLKGVPQQLKLLIGSRNLNDDTDASSKASEAGDEDDVNNILQSMHNKDQGKTISEFLLYLIILLLYDNKQKISTAYNLF